MKYELGFYIPEDDILHSHGRENLKSYTYNVHYQDATLLVVSVQEFFWCLQFIWAPPPNRSGTSDFHAHHRLVNLTTRLS
jgi:hypothetical protein